MNEQNRSWIQVCGVEDAQLAQTVSARRAQRIASGSYTEDFAKVVAAMQPGVLKGSLAVTDLQLERLRRLCQIWDVDLKPSPITSHRPVIGYLIVALKRCLFPILRLFMRDTLRQQRDFNATTITLLMELCNESSRQRSPKTT